MAILLLLTAAVSKLAMALKLMAPNYSHPFDLIFASVLLDTSLRCIVYVLCAIQSENQFARIRFFLSFFLKNKKARKFRRNKIKRATQ